MDKATDSYEERSDSELRNIEPYLARMDMTAFEKLMEQFQREKHRKLYSYSLAHKDADDITDCVAQIKGAKTFHWWVLAKINQIYGGMDDGRTE